MCHKGGNKSVASAGYGFVNSLPRAPLSLRDCCACEIPPAEQNPTLPKRGWLCHVIPSVKDAAARSRCVQFLGCGREEGMGKGSPEERSGER